MICGLELLTLAYACEMFTHLCKQVIKRAGESCPIFSAPPTFR